MNRLTRLIAVVCLLFATYDAHAADLTITRIPETPTVLLIVDFGTRAGANDYLHAAQLIKELLESENHWHTTQVWLDPKEGDPLIKEALRTQGRWQTEEEWKQLQPSTANMCVLNVDSGFGNAKYVKFQEFRLISDEERIKIIRTVLKEGEIAPMEEGTRTYLIRGPVQTLPQLQARYGKSLETFLTTDKEFSETMDITLARMTTKKVGEHWMFSFIPPKELKPAVASKSN